MGEDRPSVEVHFTLREERPLTQPPPPAPAPRFSDNTDEMLAPSTEHLDPEMHASSPPLSPLSPSPPRSPVSSYPGVRVTQGTIHSVSLLNSFCFTFCFTLLVSFTTF